MVIAIVSLRASSQPSFTPVSQAFERHRQAETGRND